MIGKSNREDVIKKYGPLPENWNHENYIYFNDKGIAFDFDEKKILTQIKIFKIYE
jgi:hypothetical protein